MPVQLSPKKLPTMWVLLEVFGYAVLSGVARQQYGTPCLSPLPSTATTVEGMQQVSAIQSKQDSGAGGHDLLRVQKMVARTASAFG